MSTWHEKLQKPFQSRSQVSSFSTVISPWVFWKRAPSHSAWSAPTAYGSDGTTLRLGQQFVHRSNGRWISAAPSNRQLPYFRPPSPRWSGRCWSRFFLQNKPEQAEYLVDFLKSLWLSDFQSSNHPIFSFFFWVRELSRFLLLSNWSLWHRPGATARELLSREVRDAFDARSVATTQGWSCFLERWTTVVRRDQSNIQYIMRIYIYIHAYTLTYRLLKTYHVI